MSRISPTGCTRLVCPPCVACPSKCRVHNPVMLDDVTAVHNPGEVRRTFPLRRFKILEAKNTFLYKFLPTVRSCAVESPFALLFRLGEACC